MSGILRLIVRGGGRALRLIRLMFRDVLFCSGFAGTFQGGVTLGLELGLGLSSVG